MDIVTIVLYDLCIHVCLDYLDLLYFLPTAILVKMYNFKCSKSTSKVRLRNLTRRVTRDCNCQWNLKAELKNAKYFMWCCIQQPT